MNKADSITNGNVNNYCNYCNGCGYHKMSCATQKATVFLPKIVKLRIENRKMRHAKNEAPLKQTKDSVMYDGTLLRRSVLNQIHSFAIEVEKGEIDGGEFAKFVKNAIERLFDEENLNKRNEHDNND